jgi:hypothetical protein
MLTSAASEAGEHALRRRGLWAVPVAVALVLVIANTPSSRRDSKVADAAVAAAPTRVPMRVAATVAEPFVPPAPLPVMLPPSSEIPDGIEAPRLAAAVRALPAGRRVRSHGAKSPATANAALGSAATTRANDSSSAVEFGSALTELQPDPVQDAKSQERKVSVPVSDLKDPYVSSPASSAPNQPGEPPARAADPASLPAQPTLDIQQLSVRGAIAPLRVLGAIERIEPAFTRCYELYGRRLAVPAVRMDAEVDPAGRVRTSNVSSGKSSEFDACLARACHKLKLRSPDGGFSASWNLRFDAKPRASGPIGPSYRGF